MELLHGVENLKTSLQGSVVSIGNFDGLHRGHRVLIHQLKQDARAAGVPSVVFTFHPHPMKVLAPGKELRRLFLIEDLVEQLQQEGIDYLVLQPFSRAFSGIGAEEFLSQYLVQPLAPKGVVVGHDFRFGEGRTGDVKTLEAFCEHQDIQLNIIAPVSFAEGVVSSTRIRKLIGEGGVSEAESLLGRAFYVKGVVEKGDGRGRKIGFPTANIRLLSETLPKEGVYVTTTIVDGKSLASVTNVGKNPTFFEEKLSEPLRVESHLLSFSENIYGREVRVVFHQRIRDEKKFSGVEELVAQIQKDAEFARSYHTQRGAK